MSTIEDQRTNGTNSARIAALENNTVLPPQPVDVNQVLLDMATQNDVSARVGTEALREQVASYWPLFAGENQPGLVIGDTPPEIEILNNRPPLVNMPVLRLSGLKVDLDAQTLRDSINPEDKERFPTAEAQKDAKKLKAALMALQKFNGTIELEHLDLVNASPSQTNVKPSIPKLYELKVKATDKATGNPNVIIGLGLNAVLPQLITVSNLVKRTQKLVDSTTATSGLQSRNINEVGFHILGVPGDDPKLSGLQVVVRSTPKPPPAPGTP
jgi:hypothetical protein